MKQAGKVGSFKKAEIAYMGQVTSKTVKSAAGMLDARYVSEFRFSWILKRKKWCTYHNLFNTPVGSGATPCNKTH